MSRGGARQFRCAIYTRKSTEEGLEQDFNSLQAQREACEAYIRSQKHEGWRLLPAAYDDGGFSGGSTDRPALQRLLADIQSGVVDVVVVYKVDRLTRSLTDFARIVDIFDRQSVSFVSVTQAFNTTTSMGRLTLNVLLSFAQFEREVTGERIRDKIAASKRKGMWMGGVIPLGYRVENRKLLVDDAEAETVRFIFSRYLELGSVPALQRDLREREVKTRQRILASGQVVGGIPFTNGPLSHLLRNRIYLGEIRHKGQSYPGEHIALVAEELFNEVQARLAANQKGERGRCHPSQALLIGRIYDDRGNRMTPAHANKGGVRYRYYVSNAVAQGRKGQAGSVPRVPAPDIDALVVGALRASVSADQAENDRCLVEQQLKKVIITKGAIEIWMSTAEDGSAMKPMIVPWVRPPHTRKREVIGPGGEEGRGLSRPIRAEARAKLLEAIARARAWVDQLIKGEVTSTEEIARREGLSERSVRMSLNLAFLAPGLVQAIIAGKLRRGEGVTSLAVLPSSWADQWTCRSI